MRVINVDPIIILLGVVALCKGEIFLAIALLYMGLAIPTQIVSEVERKINGWLYLIGKEAQNVNKVNKENENKKGKKILVNLWDTFLIIMFLLCIYSSGRLRQIKIDQQTLNEMANNYNNLMIEFNDYKKNSYVLHH